MNVDYIDSMGSRLLSEEERAAHRKVMGRIRPTLERAGRNLFLVEALVNRYQPAPPPGWFGMRSSSRRIFMQLNADGGYPPPSEWQRRLDAGEFQEAPFTA